MGTEGVLAVSGTAQLTGIEIASQVAGSLEKWTNVGIKAGHVGTDPTLSTAIGLVDALGSAIPFAGPLACLISGIMGFYAKSETSIIREKLQKMNQQLEHIDEHLDQVLHTIVQQVRDTTIKSHYQMQIDKMKATKIIYTRFMGNPTNVTRKDFRDSCREVKMLVFADWLEKGLTGNTVLPLRALIVEDYNMGNLNVWSYRITQALAKAAFLHITCVGVADESEETITSTLNGNSAGGKGDIAIFQEIFRNVIRSFNEARKEIKRNHFLRAETEAKAYLDSHTSASHRDFVDGLSAQLSRNYPERAWFIAAWNGNTIGHSLHTFSFNNQTAWMWRVHSQRNLLLGSIIPHPNSHLSNEIQQCIRESWQRKVDQRVLARDVYNDIQTHIKTPLSAFAVIKFTVSVQAYWVEGYGFFTNARYGKDSETQVSILTILYDPTFDTTEEICQMTDDINYHSAPTGYHCCLRDPTRHCPDDEICPGCH